MTRARPGPILFRSISRTPPGSLHTDPEPGTTTAIIMAKSQTKGGGPRRGKKRIRKMGMGSGARVAKAKAQDKKTRG